MKKTVATERAPQAIGPYSQAVVHNGMAYLSGQIPLDPATGQLVESDIAVQTARVLENLKAVLEACGSGLDQVVKTTVYLQDMREFARMKRNLRNLLFAESASPLDGGGRAFAARCPGRD